MKDTNLRARDILRARNAGVLLRELARKYDISAAQVRNIEFAEARRQDERKAFNAKGGRNIIYRDDQMLDELANDVRLSRRARNICRFAACGLSIGLIRRPDGFETLVALTFCGAKSANKIIALVGPSRCANARIGK